MRMKVNVLTKITIREPNDLSERQLRSPYIIGFYDRWYSNKSGSNVDMLRVRVEAWLYRL